MNSEEKNLLDLKHSLYSTKGALFFSIGIGGAIAIFFGLWQLIEDTKLPILIAEVWIVILGWMSIKYFNRCSEIQIKIEESLGKHHKA